MAAIEPEYADAFKAWKKDPTPAQNAAILGTIAPIIQGAIKTHVGQTNPLLESKARRMALEGLRSYDVNRGTRLSTHLYGHLQGLKRVNRQQTQILHVPERVSIERFHLNEAEKALEHELGHLPTDEELADRTGYPPRRLARLRQFLPAVAEGTVEQTGLGGEAPYKRQQGLWQQMVYDGLDAHHKHVMERAFGLHGRKPLPGHAIAMELGRSPGAISQAKARIQALLDQQYAMENF